MSYIFISYNHDDGDFADNLKEKIKEAGFEPWIDTAGLRAGEDWRAEIDQAIEEASALIVVMTPKAKESEYVTYEWAFALGAGVKVIPILLKPTDLHPRLGALQYLDFTNRMARPWDKLIEALQKAVDHAPHTIRLSSDVPPEIKRVITGAIAALDSASPTERKAAVKTLAQTDHPAAREALAEAVQHSIRDVRRFAFSTLIRLKDARAVPYLLNSLHSEDWYARRHAAEELGNIENAAAVPGLLDALCDEEPYVRAAAARALGQIGDVAAVPSLVERLSDTEESRISTGGPLDERVCNVAAKALRRIGTPEALAAVEEWQRLDTSATGRPGDR
jgi:hypothetical protein